MAGLPPFGTLRAGFSRGLVPMFCVGMTGIGVCGGGEKVWSRRFSLQHRGLVEQAAFREAREAERADVDQVGMAVQDQIRDDLACGG